MGEHDMEMEGSYDDEDSSHHSQNETNHSTNTTSQGNSSNRSKLSTERKRKSKHGVVQFQPVNDNPEQLSKRELEKINKQIALINAQPEKLRKKNLRQPSGKKSPQSDDSSVEKETQKLSKEAGSSKNTSNARSAATAASNTQSAQLQLSSSSSSSSSQSNNNNRDATTNLSTIPTLKASQSTNSVQVRVNNFTLTQSSSAPQQQQQQQNSSPSSSIAPTKISIPNSNNTISTQSKSNKDSAIIITTNSAPNSTQSNLSYINSNNVPMGLIVTEDDSESCEMLEDSSKSAVLMTPVPPTPITTTTTNTAASRQNNNKNSDNISPIQRRTSLDERQRKNSTRPSKQSQQQQQEEEQQQQQTQGRSLKRKQQRKQKEPAEVKQVAPSSSSSLSQHVIENNSASNNNIEVISTTNEAKSNMKSTTSGNGSHHKGSFHNNNNNTSSHSNNNNTNIATSQQSNSNNSSFNPNQSNSAAVVSSIPRKGSITPNPAAGQQPSQPVLSIITPVTQQQTQIATAIVIPMSPEIPTTLNVSQQPITSIMSTTDAAAISNSKINANNSNSNIINGNSTNIIYLHRKSIDEGSSVSVRSAPPAHPVVKRGSANAQGIDEQQQQQQQQSGELYQSQQYQQNQQTVVTAPSTPTPSATQSFGPIQIKTPFSLQNTSSTPLSSQQQQQQQLSQVQSSTSGSSAINPISTFASTVSQQHQQQQPPHPLPSTHNMINIPLRSNSPIDEEASTNNGKTKKKKKSKLTTKEETKLANATASSSANTHIEIPSNHNNNSTNITTFNEITSVTPPPAHQTAQMNQTKKNETEGQNNQISAQIPPTTGATIVLPFQSSALTNIVLTGSTPFSYPILTTPLSTIIPGAGTATTAEQNQTNFQTQQQQMQQSMQPTQQTQQIINQRLITESPPDQSSSRLPSAAPTSGTFILPVPPAQSLIFPGVQQSQQQQQQSESIPEVKTTRKLDDPEYRIRMKRGPMNTKLYEDQSNLFLKLNDYQESIRRDREVQFEKYCENIGQLAGVNPLEEISGDSNNCNLQAKNAPSLQMYPFSNSTSTAAIAAAAVTSMESKGSDRLGNTNSSVYSMPPLFFKANAFAKDDTYRGIISATGTATCTSSEIEAKEIQGTPSNGNGSNGNIVADSGTVNASTGQENNVTEVKSKSRVKSIEQSSMLIEKSFILHDRILKKFKTSEHADSFRDPFSQLHSDFASTYLTPSFCKSVLNNFNINQSLNNQNNSMNSATTTTTTTTTTAIDIEY